MYSWHFLSSINFSVILLVLLFFSFQVSPRKGLGRGVQYDILVDTTFYVDFFIFKKLDLAI